MSFVPSPRAAEGTGEAGTPQGRLGVPKAVTRTPRLSRGHGAALRGLRLHTLLWPSDLRAAGGLGRGGPDGLLGPSLLPCQLHGRAAEATLQPPAAFLGAVTRRAPWGWPARARAVRCTHLGISLVAWGGGCWRSWSSGSEVGCELLALGFADDIFSSEVLSHRSSFLLFVFYLQYSLTRWFSKCGSRNSARHCRGARTRARLGPALPLPSWKLEPGPGFWGITSPRRDPDPCNPDPRLATRES